MSYMPLPYTTPVAATLLYAAAIILVLVICRRRIKTDHPWVPLLAVSKIWQLIYAQAMATLVMAMAMACLWLWIQDQVPEHRRGI